jgi:SNF2 family DNA or RNA helicase
LISRAKENDYEIPPLYETCGTLVVAPRNIAAQWKSEIKKFHPETSVLIYDGSKKE